MGGLRRLDLDARLEPVLPGLGGQEVDALPQPLHRVLLHPRLVMGGGEAQAAVQQRHRHAITQVEVGHAVFIADDLVPVRIVADADLPDLLRIWGMLGDDLFQCRDRRGDRKADAVFLDVGFQNAEHLPKPALQRLWRHARGHRVKEIAVARVKNIAAAGEARPHQRRHLDGIAGRHARKDIAFQRMRAVQPPCRQARGFLCKIVEQDQELRLVKLHQAARGKPCAKERPIRMAGQGRARKAEPRRLRFAKADAQCVSQTDGADERIAAGPGRLGHSQRRRHHPAAGMGLAGFVGIVGFIGMGGHAIGQRRLDQRHPVAAAQHRRDPGPAQSAHIALPGPPGFERRAGDNGRQRVENVQPRLQRDLFGDLAAAPVDRRARQRPAMLRLVHVSFLSGLGVCAA